MTWIVVACTVVPGIVLFALLVLYAVLVQAYTIPSASMAPTLQVNDIVYVTRHSYFASAPKDGELVAFDPPVASSNYFIKRIVAVGGEQLGIHAGVLYRNGTAVAEPYTKNGVDYELKIKDFGIYVDGTRIDPHDGDVPPRSMWQAPDRVPNGYYVMLGDNRDDSEDSHIWGFAQNGGTFATGPRAGHAAGKFQHAVWIAFPWSRRQALP